MTHPRLTVVVPHFGDPVPTLTLVGQVRRQVPDAQVVVVDDCSPIPFPESTGVDLVRRHVNGGFGSAVNAGAAVARGQLLLILNSDLDLPPTLIPDLLDAAAPWQPAVCAPALVQLDGTTEWSGRLFPGVGQQVVEWLTPLARYREQLQRAVGHDPGCTPGRTAVTDWLVGAALLVPLGEFLSVGGFDERFFMNVEEVDLQRRLRERGLPAVYLGGATVRHVGGGSSDPALRRSWLMASRLAYADKWGGRGRLQLALTGATAVNLAANGLRRACGRSVEPLSTARRELTLIWR
jgi:N-acetylglucosaminyl-diphospho-decaprenol L-rhamnosyltransferase